VALVVRTVVEEDMVVLEMDALDDDVGGTL